MDIKKKIKDSLIPFLFALAAIIIELSAVYVTDGTIFISNPYLCLTVLGLLVGVQFLFSSDKVRYIFSCVCLCVLFAADLVFIVLLEMTGTVFDFSMLNLRNDAMAILESVPINFTYTALSVAVVSAFIVFVPALGLKKTRYANPIAARVTAGVVIAAMLLCHGILAAGIVRDGKRGDPTDKVYGAQRGGYADTGVIGKFISEMYRGAGDSVEVGSREEIDDFIYQNTKGEEVPYFGAAEGYNVITILAESLEWFSFIRDPDIYPNGHTFSEETLREAYPNLYRFYDSSVVMTQFHSREKTDISENLSLIGNYPLDYYLNYDYPENNIAYSLPNLMDTLFGVKSISFHNGTSSFYNRDDYLPQAVGFDSFISSEKMIGDSMTDYYSVGERNLDSEMIEACKEQMFPTDRRFNTYITTITMHGQYSYRYNLEKYYDRLRELGMYFPESHDGIVDGIDPGIDENSVVFNYYAAAAMELDAAIGIMLDYLEENGLMDNTLIVMFGDHNVYYQALSNYVKDIYPQSDKNADIPQLYRVPLMIKIGTQTTERIEIDKFTCTADIYPTILSLLGVRYYSNIFYGNSVFDDAESLLYSRAYDVFMTDKIYFKSLNKIEWTSSAVTPEYINDIEQRAYDLMRKVSFVDRIFADDYFRNERLEKFRQSMLSLNRK